MKHAVIKSAAIAAIAAGALFAAPMAASAYTPPETGGVSNPNVGPGGTFDFTAPPANFIPGEPVAISLTGENASGASLGFVKFAVETSILGTVPASADGGLGGVSIRLPSNASGAYTVLATSPSNPVGVSASVSAGDGSGGSNADTGSGTANGGGTAGTGSDPEAVGLAATGTDGLLTLWVGGGALALVGGGIAVAAAVRRNGRSGVTAA